MIPCNPAGFPILIEGSLYERDTTVTLSQCSRLHTLHSPSITSGILLSADAVTRSIQQKPYGGSYSRSRQQTASMMISYGKLCKSSTIIEIRLEPDSLHHLQQPIFYPTLWPIISVGPYVCVLLSSTSYCSCVLHVPLWSK